MLLWGSDLWVSWVWWFVVGGGVFLCGGGGGGEEGRSSACLKYGYQMRSNMTIVPVSVSFKTMLYISVEPVYETQFIV